jgi:hypothetical protein
VPRPPRFAALLALLLVVLGVFAGVLVAGDACAEDDCAPSCGDCLACGQVARVPPALAPTAVLSAGSALPAAAPRPSGRPPRAVEHVPLAAG